MSDTACRRSQIEVARVRLISAARTNLVRTRLLLIVTGIGTVAAIPEVGMKCRVLGGECR